jgi:thermostable 8-oxoguanine DNA glycosylase
MKATWEIDKKTLKNWQDFFEINKNRALSKRRRARNVRRIGIDLSKNEIWRVLIGCQVTTQQRSGPNSVVANFLNSESAALKLAECRRVKSVARLVEDECGGAGIRFGKKIAKNLQNIFDYLESGGWSKLELQLDTLSSHTSILKERQVIAYLLEGKKFPGLGQKQARNFIQWLGLSRYEVPLDSRVLKKMKELGTTLVPGSNALTDEAVYLFVQEGIQKIANSLNIYPCELDACIFASFDISKDEEVVE